MKFDDDTTNEMSLVYLEATRSTMPFGEYMDAFEELTDCGYTIKEALEILRDE